MLDVDTFLTALYVMVDDFCHSRPQKERLSGPDASLSPSEVVTLAIFSRWSRFRSERDFYRYATGYLQDAFTTLPERSQFNRLVRSQVRLIEEVALCIWPQRWRFRAVPTKSWTARRCPSGMQSAEVKGGWPASPTSDGPQQLGMVRGLPAARGHRSYGRHHGFWLLWRFSHQPAGGRDLLRRAASTKPQTFECGIASRRSLRSRQGLRGRRKP